MGRLLTRPRTSVAVAAVLLAVAGLGASSASGHLDGFSCNPCYDENWYHSTNAILVHDGIHSWGFVSANDLGSTNEVCPGIHDGNDFRRECGIDFERYCYFAWTHGSDLDCHDGDGVSWRAMVWNKGSGTTIRVHALF